MERWDSDGRGAWSMVMAAACRGSAAVMLGPCKRVREVGNDEAKAVVQLVMTAVTWSIGSDSGGRSSAWPRRRSRSAAK
jgi:hypothetical protein